MQRNLVKILASRYGMEFEPPSWLDMAYPEQAAQTQQTTGPEADKQHIMDVFGIKKLPERG